MAWDIVYYEAADGSVPAIQFLDGCPVKVAANLLAVLDAVAEAPPPRYSGGGSSCPSSGGRPLRVKSRLVGGMREELMMLLEGVRLGEISPQRALERFEQLPFRDLTFARVDLHRELRQGAPEAVLAEGKTPAQVAAIVRALVDGGAGSVLVTRADESVRRAVREVDGAAEEHERAQLVWIARALPEARGMVAIVSGGTSDGRVVHEARVRAELLGTTVTVHEDVGVAGLHRLASALSDLERADCVVVVAGMDAALASVVGGLVAAPVIGVPTSVGYGVAEGGRTALNAMLTSCAAGLAVVGIDDGFGAGTIAALIARGREDGGRG